MKIRPGLTTKRIYVKIIWISSGLTLDSRYFLFAGSSDGQVSCDCHGEGILEIKCLFSHRDQPPDTVCGQKGFHLDNFWNWFGHTGIIHKYSLICKTYCDFVAYTDKRIKVSRIDLDLKVLDELVQKCLQFFKRLPYPWNYLSELSSRKRKFRQDLMFM